MDRSILALCLLALAQPAFAAERLFAGGAWAAHRFGSRCEAAARPLHPARAREVQARAGFMFGSGVRNGAFFVRLSRPARPGSTVIATVGTTPFLLAGRGPWGWSRSPAQDAAIGAAVRFATGMRVEARDASGRRFTDRYLLSGAPTALDAAAAGCAAR